MNERCTKENAAKHTTVIFNKYITAIMAWHHAHGKHTLARPPTKNSIPGDFVVCLFILFVIVAEKLLHLKSHGKHSRECIVTLIATH